jgi:hypothetical protein
MVRLHFAQRGVLAKLPHVEIEAVFIKVGAALLLARMQGRDSFFDAARVFGA